MSRDCGKIYQTLIGGHVFMSGLLTMKTRFGHLLRPPSWKRNGSIVEEV